MTRTGCAIRIKRSCFKHEILSGTAVIYGDAVDVTFTAPMFLVDISKTKC